MNDTVRIARLTAFTDDPDGGNPAGVVVAASMPPPEWMQAAAAAIGDSETAFLAPAGADAFDVRYFAPAAEVDFCGHATIASGVLLAADDPGRDRDLVLHSNAGPIRVAVRHDADGSPTAELTSAHPRVEPVAEDLLRAALDTFGWDAGVLAAAPPPAVGYAGVRHLLLPLARRADLAAMRYDFDRLREVMTAAELTTVALLHRADEVTWDARNPFPVGGVVEDPATGAAAAATGAWLRHHGDVEPPAVVLIRQGDDMGRPSRLRVSIDPGVGPIRVAGRAVALPDPHGVPPLPAGAGGRAADTGVHLP